MDYERLGMQVTLKDKTRDLKQAALKIKMASSYPTKSVIEEIYELSSDCLELIKAIEKKEVTYVIKN